MRLWDSERGEWIYPLTDLEKELLQALKAIREAWESDYPTDGLIRDSQTLIERVEWIAKEFSK